MNPSFSVIVPTYNRETVIARTINSVLQQTCSDWELFIIDDGSTDKTQEVVSEFLKDDRIQYYSFPNMGASVARNIGIGLSKGEYIAFLDSDDFWTLGRLESIYSNILEDNNPNKIYITDFRSQNGKNTLFKTKYLESKNFMQILLSHNFLGGTINIVAPKKVLLAIKGFDIKLTSCQDHDLYIRLAEICDINYIPGEFAVFCLDSTDRISGKNNKKLLGHVSSYNKHKHKMNNLSRILSMKKIALVAFYIKSPIFFKYLHAWILIWLLTRLHNVTDERELYLKNNFLINSIK